MHRHLQKLFTVALCTQLALLGGCGGDSSNADAGSGDAGDATDASVGGGAGGGSGGGAGGGTGGGGGGDAGAGDAGTTDAGTTDAGTTDAGTTDAGSPFDEPVPALLFDRDTGVPDLVQLNRTGLVSALRTSGAGNFSYWNVVSGVEVSETFAYLLFLHSVNGGGSFVRLRLSTGETTPLMPSLPFSEWDEAIPVTCDNPTNPTCVRFVFHKRSNRVAAVVDFKNDFALDGGSWTIDQRDLLAGTAPEYDSWWRVERGAKGGTLANGTLIGLYSPGDGGVATMRLHVSGSSAGTFERNGSAPVVTSLGNAGAGWSPPVALGTDSPHVFFHGGAAGAASLGSITTGVRIDVQSVAGTGGPWASVASISPPGSIGQVLFYPGDGGASTLGHFTPGASTPFQALGSVPLDAGYELIVPLPYVP